jgi:hypothetical protein
MRSNLQIAKDAWDVEHRVAKDAGRPSWKDFEDKWRHIPLSKRPVGGRARMDYEESFRLYIKRENDLTEALAQDRQIEKEQEKRRLEEERQLASKQREEERKLLMQQRFENEERRRYEFEERARERERQARLAAQQAEAERRAQEEALIPKDPPILLEEYWYHHALLLAQSGFGKTNAIRWRINQILPQIAKGLASLIVMEPQGDLTRHLLRLESVWRMRDRVVILDPSEPSVTVNLFQQPANNSPQALNEAIQRIERVLSTITANLTDLQRDGLTFALRALFSLPNPNMRGLIHILRNGKKVLPLEALSPSVADFFAHDYREDNDGKYIIARLNSLLANPIFEALFGQETTTFDMSREIDAGKLIIINASVAPPLYGRFWIEEVARCIELRTTTDRFRMPTTFIIDEAQRFVAEDLHFADLLNRARAARIGMLIAAHHMEQITEAEVRHSIYTNTAIKFVARTSADIHNLSRAMGSTEPSFIGTLKQYEFAYFGPDVEAAMRVKFPLVEFDNKMLQMSPAQYESMREDNRRKYAYVPPRVSAPPVLRVVKSASEPEEPQPPPAEARVQTTQSPQPSDGPTTFSKNGW